MKQNRIVWIDNIKVLAMFLVLYEHHGLENRFVSDWIWTFHLPVFFYVSGIFASSSKSFIETIKSSAIRLLLPVLLWHIIGLLLWEPVLFRYQYPEGFWRGMLEEEKLFYLGKRTGFGWFMICLFWIKIEFWVFHRLGKRLLIIMGFIFLPFLSYLLKDRIEIPYYVLNSFMAFPFFLMGFFTREKVKGLSMKKKYSITVAFLTIAVSLMLCKWTGKYSLNALDFGINPFMMYLQGLLGCVFSILICYSWQIDNQITRTLGGGTIVILLSQIPFLFAAKAIYRFIFRPDHPAPYFDLLSALISSGFIMMLMYFIINAVNHYVPILNGQIEKR